jgi:hypothetical protein
MRDRLAIALGYCVALLASSGCSQELGPERFPTTRVEGRVTIGDAPIRRGWIEFNPIESTVGNLRCAPIRPDGSYSADRVPIGRVEVSLMDTKSPPVVTELGKMGLWKFKFPLSPIRRDVPAGDATRIDIDLAAEALLYQKAAIAENTKLNASDE